MCSLGILHRALAAALLPEWKVGGNNLIICGYWSTQEGHLCPSLFSNAVKHKSGCQRQHLTITSLGTWSYSKTHINNHKTWKHTPLPHLLRKLTYWHLLPFSPPALFTSSEIYIPSLAHAKEEIFLASVCALPWLPSSSAEKWVGPWPDTTAPGACSSLVQCFVTSPTAAVWFFQKIWMQATVGHPTNSPKVFNTYFFLYGLSLTSVFWQAQSLVFKHFYRKPWPIAYLQILLTAFYRWTQYSSWRFSLKSMLTITSVTTQQLWPAREE